MIAIGTTVIVDQPGGPVAGVVEGDGSLIYPSGQRSWLVRPLCETMLDKGPNRHGRCVIQTYPRDRLFECAPGMCTAVAAVFDHRHGAHNLDDPRYTAGGYDVIQTVDDEGRLGGRLVRTVWGGGRYAEALEAVRAIRARTGKAWAFPATRYACGCRWSVFSPLGGVELNHNGIIRTHPVRMADAA